MTNSMTETQSRAVFLSLLGPLVLTAVFCAAGVLRAPALLMYVLVALVVTAWMAFAFWATRGREGALEQDLLSAEQQRLMGDLREFVAREVGGARSELERSRVLMRDAIGQLHASFHSLQEQSRQQGAMITNLVEHDGAGSPGVRRFAEDAGKLINSLTQVLANGSHESVKSVQTIDQMATHLDGIFGLMSDLKVLADQTTKLAADAAAHSSDPDGDVRHSLLTVSDEVRHLAERSANFNQRIRELVNNAKDIVSRVRVRVEETADREMNTSIEAKTQADTLMQQVGSINRSLASGIRVVSDCGTQIREDVGKAVRSLQFEDIASQALTAANIHLERLAAINQDATQLQQALTVQHASMTERLLALEKFARHLREKRNVWEKPAHKPVSQIDMQPGSVEIF
jgi:methyl-accepting chemotaxis protein